MSASLFDAENLEWDWSALAVAPAPRFEVTRFLHDWHYAQTGGQNTYNFGLYHGLQIVGVACFGYPASQSAVDGVFGPGFTGRVMDLQRFALIDEAPTNSESWFVVRALRALKHLRPEVWAVTSFADATEGHVGIIYQATNAIYSGVSHARVQYRDEKGRLRSDRMKGATLLVSGKPPLGWTQERRLGKHRYLFLTPDNRTHRKELRRLLLWPSLPYPKAVTA